jgi:hypothetical protein
VNSALSCSSLGKTYNTTAGPVTANDVDLEIRDGVRGHRRTVRSGKTTLLSLLGGLEAVVGVSSYRKPLHRRFRDLSDYRRRQVGLFQAYNLCLISPPSRARCSPWSSLGRTPAPRDHNRVHLYGHSQGRFGHALCASAAANSSG